MKSLEIPAEKTRLIEVISFVLDYAKNLGFEKKELFQLSSIMPRISALRKRNCFS